MCLSTPTCLLGSVSPSCSYFAVCTSFWITVLYNILPYLSRSLLLIHANPNTAWYSLMWPLMNSLSQSALKSELHNSPSINHPLMQGNAFLHLILTWLIACRGLWWQLDISYLFSWIKNILELRSLFKKRHIWHICFSLLVKTCSGVCEAWG